MSEHTGIFFVQINNFIIKGFKINLNTKFNVTNIFKTDAKEQDELITLFNSKLLKLILHLESYNSTN